MHQLGQTGQEITQLLQNNPLHSGIRVILRARQSDRDTRVAPRG